MPPAALTAAAPDAAEEILCPLCRYNLRGLPEPRCPKCGGKFDWDDLTNPAKRRHPYLFEHHPERNFRSFIQTLLGGFRPRRFWRTLHPAQPYRPRRLIVYWFVCLFTCLLVPLSDYLGLAMQSRGALLYSQKYITAYYLGPGAGAIGPPNPARNYATEEEIAVIQHQFGSTQNYIDTFSPTLRHIFQRTQSPLTDAVGFSPLARGDWLSEILSFGVFLECGIVVWPWIAALSLMLLRSTMRQASVQRAHLMRVTIYSADLIVWLALIQTALVIAYFCNLAPYGAAPRGRWMILEYASMVMPYAPFLLALIVSYRFFIAIRQYLRFRHALGIVIAVQLIFVLLIFQIMAVMYG